MVDRKTGRAEDFFKDPKGFKTAQTFRADGVPRHGP
jgi:hypothetical protein